MLIILENRLQWYYSFVYEGKEEIHKYMQYEVSKTVCMDRTTNQRKVPKWLQFKNYMLELLNI